MTASYRVYIDESGDEGFRFLPAERGSSRWFVLSAVVLRKSKDLSVVELMREVRKQLGKDPKKALHFRELKHEQRVPFVRAIGQTPLRTLSVLIHKPTIDEPERFQDEAFRLYRYATRLLLERVSWLCRDRHNEGDGDGSADLVFLQPQRHVLRGIARATCANSAMAATRKTCASSGSTLTRTGWKP
jgi:hypothetical protein